MIHLVAVQARVDLARYGTEAAFRSWVDELVGRARRGIPPAEPVLVALPEDLGTPLAFLGQQGLATRARTLQAAAGGLIRKHWAATLWRRLRHRVGWLRALALARAEVMARVYVSACAAAARRHRVILVPGSILLPDWAGPPDPAGTPGGGPAAAVYNVAFLFGPDGQVRARRRKAYLIDLEGPAGLDLVPAPAPEGAAVGTPAGRVAIAICLDAFEPAVRKAIAAGGAEILVQPSANPQPWDPEQRLDWLRGSWGAVQEDGGPLYAVNPMLVGNLFDVGFEGQSAICAKAPLPGPPGYAGLPPRPGFVGVARTWTEEEIVRATVPAPPGAAR